jgi:hypothetical protein
MQDGVALAQGFINRRVVGRELAQIDLLAPVITHQLEAVLKDGHHAEPEQVDLDQAEIGAVLFVPLDDDAAGHGCGFERHDAVEASLANHHAAGVLAEMARHVLKGDYDVEKLATLRLLKSRPALRNCSLPMRTRNTEPSPFALVCVRGRDNPTWARRSRLCREW